MAIKVALAGIGKIAIDQHVPAIYGSKQWELAATLEFPENCQTPIAAALNFVHPAGAAVTAEFDWRPRNRRTV